MLIQSFWLSGLLFIASATAHAYLPAGLRPRYLSTGTGISVPSTSTPPYPTGSIIGTAIPTVSTNTSTSTSTVPPPSTPSKFYLITAGTGTFLDGYYLTYSCCYGGASHGTLAILRFIESPDPISREDPIFSEAFTFSLNGNSTIKNTYASVGRAFGSDSTSTLYWFFNNGDIYGVAEDDVVDESICEILAGELKCVTGVNTLFYVCGEQVVRLGTAVPVGCSQLTLLVMPV